jgi:hypothetical protein
MSRYLKDPQDIEPTASPDITTSVDREVIHSGLDLEARVSYATEALSNLTVALERVERMTNAQVGVPESLSNLTAALERVERMANTQVEVPESIAEIYTVLRKVELLARAQIDEIGLLQSQLAMTRVSAQYEAAFAETEPLVTVRIATFNRPGPLVERTLPSVLAQTYKRLEIIVVGDGCTDNTGDRVSRIDDPRVQFVNLPYRYPYPDDANARWLVAGSPAMNFGAQMAKGAWIAPLDDDDEFISDHIEKLLQTARQGNFEMAYGNILRKAPDPSDDMVLRSNPPRLGHFGFQGAIYMSCLRFMQYDPRCWMLNEPGDWNLCRRMIAAGVRIGWLDEVVSLYYPGQLWPQQEPRGC